MTQIYDRGYKKLFSNKGFFRQLLESFVPFAWVKELDFEQCELLDKTFISKEYEKRESDVIYKVPLRGKVTYIVILIEFQSSSDQFMALRVLHYIVSFYMRMTESKASFEKLPAVFPIVVYSGQDKWTAPTHLANLIENSELLGDFALNFKYFKIAENEITVERLLEIGNAVSTLFLGEVHYDRILLIEELSKVLQQENQQMVSMLFNYFEQLFNHNKLDEVDWNALDKVRTQKEINMFLENMKKSDEIAYQSGMLEGKHQGLLEGKQEGLLEGKQEGLLEGKQEGLLEGKQEGLLEGKQEGLLEGKLETAQAMLAKGFEVSLVVELTGLAVEVVESLRH